MDIKGTTAFCAGRISTSNWRGFALKPDYQEGNSRKLFEIPFVKIRRQTVAAKKGKAMVNKHWPPTTKEDKELLRMLKALSPEGLRRVQKDTDAIFVKLLAK